MHTFLLKSQKQINTPAVCIRWFDCNNYVLLLPVVAVINFIFFKTSDISFNTTVSNPDHHHGPNTTQFLSLFPSSEIWDAKPNTSSDFQICILKVVNLNGCESQKSQTTQMGQEKFDVTRLLLMTLSPARTLWSRSSDDEPRPSIEQSHPVAVTCRQPSTHSPSCQGPGLLFTASKFYSYVQESPSHRRVCITQPGK